MPHITLKDGIPGILSLFDFRPEAAVPLNALAETLLRSPSPLTRGERELIAAFVSSLNECAFCTASHRAFAVAQLPGGASEVDSVLGSFRTAPVSAKLKSLLAIAAKVQRSGQGVLSSDVDAARKEGATDVEIHDTVLIAAAFCMFNRYVDGLATVAPTDPALYAGIAQTIVENGYTAPKPA